MVFCCQNCSDYCDKNCSSDRDKLLKFEAEAGEFAKVVNNLSCSPDPITNSETTNPEFSGLF